MAKFTPGPWNAWSRFGVERVITDTRICIATIHPSSLREPAKYNAALIAAAPEMYKALKACQLQLLQQNNRHEYVEDALNLACSALVKAEGGQ